MLVDDEYLELDMLSNHIDWEKFGFRVICTAKNGRDALEKISDLQPDVVITDIKMPIMDGIEFSRQLHRTFPKTKIAFLTGYNQFEYLQTAFQVDAIDYLLKPVNFDEVAALMVNIKKKCDDDKFIDHLTKPAMIEVVRELIMEKEKLTDENAAQICRLCNSYFGEDAADPDFFIGMAFINEYSLLMETGTMGLATISRCKSRIQQLETLLDAIVVPVNSKTYLLVAKRALIVPEDWFVAREDEKQRITLLIQRDSVSIGVLLATYRSLSALYQWQLAHGAPCEVAWADAIEAEVTQAAQNNANQAEGFTSLMAFIQQGDEERAFEWLHRYFTSPSPHVSAGFLHRQTLALFDFLFDHFIQPNMYLVGELESKPDLLKKLLMIESLTVLQDTARGFLGILISRLNRLQSDPSQVIVERMKAYISNHIADPLTIEDLAKELSFSPNYLRAIFKTVTGKTVLEYITEVRLNMAVSMLQETTFQINQISLSIGYKNPSYFCAQFSKKYGLTPIEYRNKYRA
jgi:YesN/AraC family two-component response regulator